MNWTDEQLEVIRAKDRNLLVSAAAGSGKTAVLVERILSLLFDPDDPCDIDRFLILTFTRTAAAEMKERLLSALLALAEANPGREDIRRQLLLLPASRITTIDGFCAELLRAYGSLIGIDGGFRIAETGELALLEQDVLDDLLDRSFEEGDPAFLDFIETFGTGKDSRIPGNLILRTAKKLTAMPYPQKIIQDWQADLADDRITDPAGNSLFAVFFESVRALCEDGLHMARENAGLLLIPGGPRSCAAAAAADEAFFEALCGCRTYGEYFSVLRDPAHAKASLPRGKRPEDEDTTLYEIFKNRRASLLKNREKLEEDYFRDSEEAALRNLLKSAGPLRTLLTLSGRFLTLFSETKREKNLMDFPDLEQMALTLLRDPDGKPGSAARELGAQIRHIMIDEYQDSNYLQEAILTAILEAGNADYFMVGDSKQSIYSFRQARPDLFMKKHDAFGKGNGGRRIDLSANFRSRSEVTESINAVFRAIMKKEVGGIDYDDAAALRPRANFEDGASPSYKTEFLLTLTDQAEDDDDDEIPQETREAEARAIGMRIREMAGREMILDKETRTLRPVRYSDIVILLRSAAGFAEIFSHVLEGMQIPAEVTQSTGYFSAPEVVTALSYLNILGNPHQDIPLAAVLRSEIAGLSAEDLAKIRILGNEAKENDPDAGPLRDFYDAARYYVLKGQDLRLRGILEDFFETYDKLRPLCGILPVHLLLDRVFSYTGFEDVIRSGSKRQSASANLSMLRDRAAAFAKGANTGLHHFIRYIDQLHKYEIDFGEVKDSGADAVRIMTVHKSKGLEFPVVIYAGLHKQFNLTDLNDPVLIHGDYGIFSNAIDPVRRITVPTITKTALRTLMRRETIGEELRIAYVAMTRAQQKLILSAAVTNEKKISDMTLPEDDLSPAFIEKVASLLPLLLSVMPGAEAEGLVKLRRIYPSDLLWDETVRLAGEDLLSARLADPAPGPFEEELRNRFAFRYPHAAAAPLKVSVSDIKAAHLEEEAALLHTDPETVPILPAYLSDEKPVLFGSARGTAYHTFFEHLDYAALPDLHDGDVLLEAVRTQLAACREGGYLSEAEYDAVRAKDIVRFLHTEIGSRMRGAALIGTLWREQPFTLSVDAQSVSSEYGSDEKILVQGIIDAYFEEDGDLILVDYKTDRVFPGQEEELLRRYRVQLSLYASALTRLTGRSVRETYIYSVALGKSIPVSL